MQSVCGEFHAAAQGGPLSLPCGNIEAAPAARAWKCRTGIVAFAVLMCIQLAKRSVEDARNR